MIDMIVVDGKLNGTSTFMDGLFAVLELETS